MKLKAQNTMEVITMVALVVVVVVSAFMFMNGKNSKLANLSAINSTSTKLKVLQHQQVMLKQQVHYHNLLQI